MVLADVSPVSPRCTRIKGDGGAKAAVRQVMARLGDNRFVIRSAAAPDRHPGLDPGSMERSGQAIS
jgi:hypothetical protein